MIRKIIQKLLERRSLTRREAFTVMENILNGKVSEAQIGAFLMALQMKGSTKDEIAGSVEAYRKRLIPLSIDDDNAIDICGTGGDNLGTFNISTATAFVAAGAGARVIKHGYHSVSSKCGSADVLAEMGIRAELFPDEFYQLYEELGLAFIFASRYRTLPWNFAGIRQSIGARTLMNILDPITKPALTKRQLIGVWDPKLARIVAEVLKEIKISRAMIVSGEEGLDEISLSGSTQVVELINGKIKEYSFKPEDVGLSCRPVSELRGGDAKLNTKIILGILNGEKNAAREVTLLNASGALMVAGLANDFAEGIELARKAVDSGAALGKYQRLLKYSRKIGKKS